MGVYLEAEEKKMERIRERDGAGGESIIDLWLLASINY